MKWYVIKMRDTQYWVIGSFDTAEEAGEWATADQAEDGGDPRWQVLQLENPHMVKFIKPTKLRVTASGSMGDIYYIHIGSKSYSVDQIRQAVKLLEKQS